MNTDPHNSASFIRDAEPQDASRLAEILVFSKRTHYRRIFRDDDFSFGVLQVYPIAGDYLAHPETLSGIRVYDDGFVKGLIHTEGDEIAELYVDPFFERQHIGSALMADALSRILHPWLWVLEDNDAAVRFYQRQGFSFTGERCPEEGSVFKAKMRHTAPVSDILGKIVHVIIDRPLGSRHPEHADMVYPVNYGYVPGVPGGDGEDQDAYILGINEPVREFTGPVIAVIRREDDIEEKWVTAPAGLTFSEPEIRALTNFQEKYFQSKVESQKKDCNHFQ